MATAEVILAGGVWREGGSQRTARLRAPEPEEERELVEGGTALLPAERVTALLARSVEVDGDSGDTLARALSAGDRAELLLQLRRLLCGEALECVLSCPHPDCGEQLELSLQVTDLLAEREPLSGPVHELRVAGERVVFRLPTGGDEEQAARRALADPEAAVAELLAACLVETPDPAPAELAEAVAEEMAALDPQADVLLSLVCPECEREGTVPFDPAAYLFAELAGRVRRLEREVHVLASWYGWSEQEIVALPPERRSRYIELIETEPGAVR